MLFLQTPDLMLLEREERRLQPREKCRAEDQNRNGAEKKRENRQRHPSVRLSCADRFSSGKTVGVGLPVIAAVGS